MTNIPNADAVDNALEAITTLPVGASVDIYTEGASKNNPGPAGWGLVVIHEGNTVAAMSASIGKASNVVAEMKGALMAILLLSDRPDISVTIHSDNQMLIKGMTEWLPGWKARAGRKASGKPVENWSIWQALDGIASTLPLVKWQWVRGHDGNVFNDMADELASNAALGAA